MLSFSDPQHVAMMISLGIPLSIWAAFIIYLNVKGNDE